MPINRLVYEDLLDDLSQHARNDQDCRSKRNQYKGDQDPNPEEKDLAFVLRLGRSDSHHIVKDAHDLKKVFHTCLRSRIALQEPSSWRWQ